jgi:hypothetical protein
LLFFSGKNRKGCAKLVQLQLESFYYHLVEKKKRLRKVGTASTRKPLLLFRKKRKGCAGSVHMSSVKKERSN